MKAWLLLPFFLTGCAQLSTVLPQGDASATAPAMMAMPRPSGSTYTLLGAVSAIPNATKYTVYVGTSSRSYSESYVLIPPTRQFSIPNRQIKQAYFLTATATANGLESLYGNEVNYSRKNGNSTIGVAPQPPPISTAQ